MKITAIVQCRTDSTRLPGKALRAVGGEKLIDKVLRPLNEVDDIEEILVATTTSKSDDDLVAHLISKGITVYRGNEHNVLERFTFASREVNATHIVRVTADDPFKDPAVISQAIKLLIETPGVDYCSNTLSPTFPEGIDIEVFTVGALETAFKEAKLHSELEHVTPYIWKHPEKFTILELKANSNYSDYRLTVDWEVDLEVAEEIFNSFPDQNSFRYLQLVEFLDKRPDLKSKNSGIKRNEGYTKDLENERTR